jgi:hypothetical protein
VDLPVEFRNNVPIIDASLAGPINVSHIICPSKGLRIGSPALLRLCGLSLDRRRHGLILPDFIPQNLSHLGRQKGLVLTQRFQGQSQIASGVGFQRQPAGAVAPQMG